MKVNQPTTSGSGPVSNGQGSAQTAAAIAAAREAAKACGGSGAGGKEQSK